MERVPVMLSVNGSAHEVEVEPRRLLSDVLREQIGLTGTHVGCEHGVCGACTVLVDGRPMRSCLLFAVQLAGAEITTIEGVAADGGGMTALQRALHEEHGLQCGFCTPGIVLTFEAFLDDVPDPSDAQIREVLSGNLCRCTGYASIVRAVRRVAEARRNGTPEATQ